MRGRLGLGAQFLCVFVNSASSLSRVLPCVRCFVVEDNVANQIPKN